MLVLEVVCVLFSSRSFIKRPCVHQTLCEKIKSFNDSCHVFCKIKAKHFNASRVPSQMEALQNIYSVNNDLITSLLFLFKACLNNLEYAVP